MKKFLIPILVLFLLFGHRHHKKACACDGVVAAPAFAYSQVAVATPYYASPAFVSSAFTPFAFSQPLVVVNNRRSVVAVDSGVNVRVHNGPFATRVVVRH